MEADADMDVEITAAPIADNAGHPLGHAWNLLSVARQLVAQGKPSLALQTLVAGMRSIGGEAAVFQILHRARELYRNKLCANTAEDELASLFARCAIAEAQPLNSERIPDEVDMVTPETLQVGLQHPPTSMPEIHESSILAESGRRQVVLDAVSDGSSFICLQCGGLVGNLRKEEHFAYWCGKL